MRKLFITALLLLVVAFPIGAFAASITQGTVVDVGEKPLPIPTPKPSSYTLYGLMTLPVRR